MKEAYQLTKEELAEQYNSRGRGDEKYVLRALYFTDGK